MARLVFPSDREVRLSRPYRGAAFVSGAGLTATVYTDADGTVLADVENFDGTPNVEATFTVDTESLLPLFLGPADGTDTLYLQVNNPGAPVVAVSAVADVSDLTGLVSAEAVTRAAGDAALSDRADVLEAAIADEVTDRTDADAAVAAAAAADATSKANLAAAASQPLDSDLTAIAGLDSSTAGALVTDGSGWIRKTYAQLKTALGLVKADVGLGNVDNTSDANKPVSTATQTALDAKLAITTASGTYVPFSTVNAKGDLLVATADDTIDRLAVGADGYQTVADSTTATGLAWMPRSRSVSDTHTPLEIANTTAETSLGTLAVPTSVAAGDVVRALFVGDLLNNTAGAVTFKFRLYLGTTLLFDGNASSQAQSATRRQWRFEAEALIVTPASDQRTNGFAVIGTTSAFSFVTNGNAAVGRVFSAENLTAGKSFDLRIVMGTADANALVNCKENYLEVAKR